MFFRTITRVVKREPKSRSTRVLHQSAQVQSFAPTSSLIEWTIDYNDHESRSEQKAIFPVHKEHPAINAEICKTLDVLLEKFLPAMQIPALQTPSELLAPPFKLICKSTQERAAYAARQAAMQQFREKYNEMADIVPVDKSFKILFTHHYNVGLPEFGQLNANATYQCYVADYHETIDSIKFSDISRMDHADFTSKIVAPKDKIHADLFVRFKMKNGDKYSFVVKMKDSAEIHSLLYYHLMELLPTSHVETSTRSKVRQLQHYNMTWGKHKLPFIQDWESVKYVQEHYDKQSDPLFVQMFSRHILANNNQESLIVFDMGAGKGRLAAKLITEAMRYGVPVEYILLEPESSQCDLAQEKIEHLQAIYGDKFKASIYQQTMDEFAQTSAYQQYTARVDCMVSSGGPLNLSVVDYNTAHRNLESANTLLREGGMLLASGLTDLHMTKKTFEQAGFHAHKLSEIVASNNQSRCMQMYVMEKGKPLENELRTVAMLSPGNRYRE